MIKGGAMVLNDDEILVKDKTGKFKILRGGKFYDIEENVPAKPQPVLVANKVDEILKQIRFRVDENLKGRLADIIEAYLKDVRDKYETKSVLTRETKSGGLGFLGEQADIVIGLINKFGNKKEEEPPQVLEAKAEQKNKEVLPKEEKKAEVGKGNEIVKIEEKKIEPIIVAPISKTELEIKVEEIIRESGIKIPENERQKLSNILLTHLKDIRDGYELQDTLSNSFSANVLSKEKINKILEIARRKSKSDETDLHRKKLEEIKEALEAEQRRREMVFSENQIKLNDKMKNRWQEITKRKESSPISLPEESIVRPGKERPEILSLVEFADFLDSKVEKKDETAKSEEETTAPIIAPVLKTELENKVEKILPPILEERMAVKKEVSEEKKPVPAPASTEVVNKHVLTETVANKLASEPAFAKATATEGKSASEAASTKVSASEPKPLQVFKSVSIPIRRPPPVFRKDQPRLDDIKYIPKIIGPIDELRDMTLVNFRRLGASPEEAVAKIKEKLDILEHDSVIKRMAGIKAWQEAEVTKIYLEISRDCLSKGASADQVIPLRESSGRPTLTTEEYKAVLELNKFLRY